MEALAMSAIGSGQRAGVMDQLTSRLFSRPPEDLLERADADDASGEMRYRPMVELLLREIVAVGSDSRLDITEQQRRIVWALDMSGF